MLQVAPPLEIYNYPVNKFVAGFIGSPAMNFINVSLVEKGSILLVAADGIELPIPPEKNEYLEHLVNSEVILGIRPEHLEEKSFADRSVYSECFSATVDVIETLGAEVQLNVTAADHALIAPVDTKVSIWPSTWKIFISLRKIRPTVVFQLKSARSGFKIPSKVQWLRCPAN
jgi:multiple sugar transport system ATP-binding protein